MPEFNIRALEGCTSFLTCDVLDMEYYTALVERAAAYGVNTLILFIIPDSYYPETSATKSWEFELGFDWPCEAYPQYRNPNCPNAHPDTEYLPQLIRLCHAAGIKVYLRTINNKHKWLFPQHEAWRAKLLNRHDEVVPTQSCSWDNNEFMDYYYTVLRDLLNRYAAGSESIDGLILDQQKCFGLYVNDETVAKFEQTMNRPFRLLDREALCEYWSTRNAQRVKDTVAFCKAINPSLHIGVTLEGLLRERFENGMSGMGHAFFNHRSTGVDFIHHQVFDQSEEDGLFMWEKLSTDGPLWIMLDPTAADAGWDKEYWGWTPRTPDSIAKDIEKVRTLRHRLSHSNNLAGITEFPITRLPLDHPNLSAVLQSLSQI
jgi:hypothetical protein